MTGSEQKDPNRLSADEVYRAEYQIVHERRRKAAIARSDPASDPSESGSEGKSPVVQEAEPIGLALSGGGVRSAAFGLGVMQALHRYGVLRWIDYLSAVSGGTYAAAMFSTSIKYSDDYAPGNSDIAVGPAGRNSQFVRSVAQRGNYLFRLDLFLLRFIPNAILNLVPRVCLLLAVSSFVAWAWRLIDLDGIRDHLSAFGLDDLGAAYLPAFCCAAAWLILFAFAWIADAVRVRRAATILLALAIASSLIGTAVVIGNGDVTFSGAAYTVKGEESRIDWLHGLWKPFVSIVAVGCLPLLAGTRLLRSGSRPRNWIDSWFFYYASFALSLGIPLVAIGYFARENLSGFNQARGPAFLRGDLKSTEALQMLLRDADPGSQVYIPKYDVLITPQLHAAFSDDPLTHDLVRQLEETRRQQHDLRLQLLLTGEFPAPVTYDTESPQATNKPPDELTDMTQWWLYKYLRGVRVRMVEFGKYVVSPSNETVYGRFVHLQAERRWIFQELATRLNKRMRTESFFSASLGKPNDSARKLSELSPELDEQVSRMVIVLSQSAEPSAVADPVDLAGLNRNLLEAIYPKVFRARTEVRRANLINHDQWHRFFWFCGSSVAALFFGWVINPNRTGMHGYYRDRLAATYLMRDPPSRIRVHPEKFAWPLSGLEPHKRGAPYPLFNASTLMSPPWKHAEQLESPFASFLLSSEFCGSPSLGYLRTSSLERGQQPLVADTIAISGGAFNPAYFVHHILRILMSVLNLRTGQLFPNPRRDRSHVRHPRELTSFWQSLKRSVMDRDDITHSDHLLLTDGGHAENLGLEALLLRRCRLIIVSDAGHDPEHSLDDLAKVVRRLESTHGIRITDLSPDSQDSNDADGSPLRVPANMAQPIQGRGKDALERRARKLGALFRKPRTSRHFFVAQIEYPPTQPAATPESESSSCDKSYLIYIKPCLTGDEGLQLYNYACKNRDFPHESTLDQAFDEAQFEAYRRLGYHSGVDLCRELPDPADPERKPEVETYWGTNAHGRVAGNKELTIDTLIADLLPPETDYWDRVTIRSTRRQVQDILARFVTTRERSDKLIAELKSLGDRLELAIDLLVTFNARVRYGRQPEDQDARNFRRTILNSIKPHLTDVGVDRLLRTLRRECKWLSPTAIDVMEWLADPETSEFLGQRLGEKVQQSLSQMRSSFRENTKARDLLELALARLSHWTPSDSEDSQPETVRPEAKT